MNMQFSFRTSYYEVVGERRHLAIITKDGKAYLSFSGERNKDQTDPAMIQKAQFIVNALNAYSPTQLIK